MSNELVLGVIPFGLIRQVPTVGGGTGKGKGFSGPKYN